MGMADYFLSDNGMGTPILIVFNDVYCFTN